LKIKTNKLLKILRLLRPGLAQKAIIEQTKHFIFTGTNIITYNDEVCISYPFESDFVYSVPADQFLKILSNIKDEEIDLAVKDESLNLKTKKTKAKFTTEVDNQAAETADEITNKKIRFRKLPEDFMEAIKLCVFSTSKDMSVDQIHLTGVYADGNNVVGSDDFRISHYEMKKELKDSFLIPATSVSSLVSFEIEKYGLKDGWVYFKTKDGILFCSRLIDSDYPDPLEFFDFKGMRVRLPEDLKEIVDNAAILAEGDFDVDKKINVRIEDGKIKCKGESDVGWIETNTKIKFKKSAEFTINPYFFSEVLNKTDTAVIGEDKILFQSDNFKHLIALF